ncbi:hypothetical protein [Phocaeicola sp.]
MNEQDEWKATEILPSLFRIFFLIPQDDWKCEVTDEQLARPVDIYVFAKLRTYNDRRTLYLVGWMSKQEFHDKAQLHEAGTLLRGKRVHYSKWDVTINELNEMESLIPKL